MTETSVGAIVGYLRLDNSDWMRETAAADAAIDKLDGKDAHVRVEVDGVAKAMASLDAVRGSTDKVRDANLRLAIAQARLNEVRDRGNASASQILSAERGVIIARRSVAAATGEAADASRKLSEANDRVDESNKRVERSSRNAHSRTGALITAIGILGPALVPVAAGTTALAGGFATMGAAGVLALVGINAEMKKGTALGLTYKATLDDGKAAIMGLAHTAASNILGPLQAAIADLQSRMPQLNGIVGEFSTMTGNAAGNLTSGLLSALIALEPMLRDAGVYVYQLSRRFDEAMSGGGVVAFGDYIRSVFPQVMDAVESLVTLAGHLVTAFAPLGTGTLAMLRLLADAINAIPTDTLADIAQVAGSVFIGFKAWRGLSAPIKALETALGGVEGMSTRAATSLRALQTSAGIIGIALAALSYVISSNAESQRNAQQATDDYADALRRSNGVIDESIRKVAYDTLQKQGAIDAAKKLGISLDDVTLAATGNQDAMRRVNVVVMDAIQNHRDLWGAAHDLRSALGENNTELRNAQQANKDLADATGQANSQTQGSVEANERAASKYGITATTLQQVADAQQKTADQTEIATVKMQEQNDAAGLLKQQLDLLNGKQLSNEEAVNAYDRAGNALARPIKDAEKALADAQKRARDVANQTGHTTGGSGVASAQLSLTQAQDKLTRLQSSGKATAEQLASAQDRVERATLRLTEAQGKAGKVTGAATKEQKDSANAAVAQAKATLAAQFSLKGSSEEAVRNRDNIIGMVKAASIAAGTNGDLASSNEKARQKFIQMRADVLKQATALGFNKDQVQELLDKIAQVPDHATPTKFDADTAPATGKTKEWVGVINGVPTWRETTFKANTGDALAALGTLTDAIAGVASKTITISAVYGKYGQAAAQAASQASRRSDVYYGHSHGGTVRGPGGPREDRALTALSPGEEVIQNGPAQKHRALLKAINDGSFDRGMVPASVRSMIAGRGAVVPLPAASRSAAPAAGAATGGRDIDYERFERLMERVMRALPNPVTSVEDIQRAAMAR
ncbi:hypothetical protein [Intrasporangium flavum]|uniref:hypothetical protein n=1 Tax=Intrasporangium flavum TaxID=1428657 RepID=UPI00096E4AFB|nr:hypothetical protein [Intrasporangium flavum]